MGAGITQRLGLGELDLLKVCGEDGCNGRFWADF